MVRMDWKDWILLPAFGVFVPPLVRSFAFALLFALTVPVAFEWPGFLSLIPVLYRCYGFGRLPFFPGSIAEVFFPKPDRKSVV